VEIQTYVNNITTVFVDEMKDNLVGVYLHGSLAMGCFNTDTSDVDMLVICSTKMTNDTKKIIIKRLLTLTQGNRNQLEMSIVLERYVKDDFVYPTPFELHYFHPKYITDENYICGGEGFYDPDLAGHMVITYHRGVTLSGEKIKNIFKPIDRQFYIKSIFNDIEDALNSIIDNPVYFTLNLCRVMYFLKEGKVSSKKEGGEWGIRNLPVEYRMIVEQCLSVYNGLAKDIYISNYVIVHFATWMVSECKQLRKGGDEQNERDS
jgi:predicted nucleotidyltransferase